MDGYELGEKQQGPGAVVAEVENDLREILACPALASHIAST